MGTDVGKGHAAQPTARRPLDEDARFGQTLLAEHLVTPEQLQDVLEVQATLRQQGMKLRLGEMLVKKGVLTSEQVRDVLQLVGKVLLHCPQCGRNYNVRNWLPGRTVLCPNCSSALEVPPADASVDASETKELGIAVPHGDSRDSKGTPFGRYRLLDELGRGGMGVVWKAWDTQLKRIVALKQILTRGELEAEQVQRFMREAQLAAKLRHPNIVSVLDVGTHKGQPFFTTDYVAGRTMDEIRKPVPASKCVPWVIAIADALAYAHQQGVVHRDIKPGNILIDTRGRPFVMDFGLAKQVDAGHGEGQKGAPLTLSGALLGTPQYMSPEQAVGLLHRVGPASDQFSLGVVFYELLTGRPPFGGKSLRDLLNAITNQEPAAPSTVLRHVHLDLDAICQRALEKAPPGRYHSLREFAEDLRCYTRGEPIQARPLSRLGRLSRRMGQHRLAVMGGLLATLLFGLLGVLMYRANANVSETLTEAMDQARRSRRASDPEHARNAYQKVLALDPTNKEARDGVNWADEKLAQQRAEAVKGEIDRRDREREIEAQRRERAKAAEAEFDRIRQDALVWESDGNFAAALEEWDQFPAPLRIEEWPARLESERTELLNRQRAFETEAEEFAVGLLRQAASHADAKEYGKALQLLETFPHRYRRTRRFADIAQARTRYREAAGIPSDTTSGDLAAVEEACIEALLTGDIAGARKAWNALLGGAHDAKARAELEDLGDIETDRTRDGVAIYFSRNQLAVVPKDSPAWRGTTQGNIRVGGTADLEGDGKREIFVGLDGSREDAGALVCLALDGRKLWQFDTGAIHWDQAGVTDKMTVSGLKIVDLDSDGRKEVISVSNNVSQFPCRVCVVSWEGKLLGEYWNPGHGGNPFAGDLDNDGKPEVLIAFANTDQNQSQAVACFHGTNIRGSAPPNGADGSQMWYTLVPGAKPPMKRITWRRDTKNGPATRIECEFQDGTWVLGVDGAVLQRP